jgi:hypothetical protein
LTEANGKWQLAIGKLQLAKPNQNQTHLPQRSQRRKGSEKMAIGNSPNLVHDFHL